MSEQDWNVFTDMRHSRVRGTATQLSLQHRYHQRADVVRTARLRLALRFIMMTRNREISTEIKDIGRRRRDAVPRTAPPRQVRGAAVRSPTKNLPALAGVCPFAVVIHIHDLRVQQHETFVAIWKPRTRISQRQRVEFMRAGTIKKQVNTITDL